MCTYICICILDIRICLRHGDIVFVTYTEPTQPEPAQSATPNADPSGLVPIDALASIKQDKVDDFLDKERGLIKRPKDTKLSVSGWLITIARAHVQ